MSIQKTDLYPKTPLYLEGQEIPTLTYFPAEKKTGRGTVVILPGGGYALRAPHEGEGYARYLNALGIDAFVCDYRISPYRFPAPLLDARRAVRTVRHFADRYGIDKDKIAIMGSSAGGHLAALAATYRAEIDGEGIDEIDGESARPDAQILCYPVIDLTSSLGHQGTRQNFLGDRLSLGGMLTPSIIADEKTPEAFIWHTSSDDGVNVINSYEYAKRLRQMNVPVEMHIYPIGGHGLGLADEGGRNIPYVGDWTKRLAAWLGLLGYLG